MASSDPGPASDEGWSQRLAPVGAAIVLVIGIGFLLLRSGSGTNPEAADGDGPSVASAPEPEAPRVETTTTDPAATPPAVTAPPLIETTTTDVSATTTTTTAAGAPDGPSQAQIDRALLRAEDLQETWTEEIVDTNAICGENPELDNSVAEGAVLFQQLNVDPVGVRQLGHNILSFADAATAERAFTTDLELLEACAGTTIELDGVQYRVQVDSDAFDDDEAAAFPCSDQNASVIIQLTNDQAPVPYIGQSAFSFRCGRNVTVTSLTTTIGVTDLSQNEFFSAGAITNTRAASLPGSS